ncbi:hypothetical protein I6H45_04565 [Anaerococcus vaginalis]|uniref:Uncharacterized protein n=2 Tax=Anaerococcus vaginalis TaxID=33037 RepID=C7HTX0_9FIRM|nr:DUF6648 family protein [Anaerococcus vaginalis]EEU12750.1 hypothetical protein HMPREF0078_0721 [Anaerococcus vaginalis ATCC 51170]QQB62751.1 hypothetical protein I6H45_04565 [Anaerococcus vaginalis]
MLDEVKKLESFNKWRKESIDLLTNQKIGKDEFLELNYRYLVKLDLKPFSNISSVLEAVYNYQYYNIMAKRSNQVALTFISKKKKKYQQEINNRENYYYLKDLATKKLLELIDYKDIEAYFIKLKSKRLTGEIFEIYLKDFDKLILHSKNKNLLQKLKEKKCFLDESKISMIDSYVNKSY